ncbi:phospholipid carrier-dependent glycosyltransferase [Microbacterium sp. cx-55]|uniref:dolichyl-phosphate-mannose--protein mannosyltransferase n=1 Tax=Microbacterium sp. cx-55 TaxID=2875948 RepID=UPI001CBA93AD|nr:phospholipid carrier-dependent glycosyltransferase [Microbacterium sp. cx-55]MBZ4485773.1 phospholipid carrier-dependent glycosyltransferase [Microbacterium sp. cx-55]UGB34343.1 phospholipid carrier-dependent glycosyltransferase [Microbacterium sp. cx-55]
MTTSAPPLLPTRRPTVFDRWRDTVRASPVLSRRVDLWTPVALVLLAAITRFVNLGHPQSIVFDETYYVKDAWSQWLLGYTADWPDGADAAFAAAAPLEPLARGSYSVHPPLGKWLIGAGMWLFGPGDAFGWRFAAALFGTATVLLVFLVARTLTGSTAVAGLAGFLLAIDGLSIVLSRIALLDGFLAFFLLLAFWFVLLDRRTHLARLAARIGARDEPPQWGPVRWNRPWLLAAGLAAGAATGVKWSGLYVLAALGIYVVVTDALARRRLRVWQWPMDAVRQGAASFLLLVPVAAVVYLSTWTGWLLTSGGYDRQSVVDGAGDAWAWVPAPLQSLWAYHEAMYAFHVGLVTPHSYASPAWQWPLLVRPTSMYWQQTGDSVEAVSSIPNPLIWWAGIAAAIFMIVLFVRRRDASAALVLTGIAATYLPWLIYPDRTIFQFYTVAMMPFLVIAIALAAREIVGGPRAAAAVGAPPDAVAARRVIGQRLVWVFVIAVTLVSLFWYPVWTAMPVPYDFWRLHNWLPTWV